MICPVRSPYQNRIIGRKLRRSKHGFSASVSVAAEAGLTGTAAGGLRDPVRGRLHFLPHFFFGIGRPASRIDEHGVSVPCHLPFNVQCGSVRSLTHDLPALQCFFRAQTQVSHRRDFRSIAFTRSRNRRALHRGRSHSKSQCVN